MCPSSRDNPVSSSGWYCCLATTMSTTTTFPLPVPVHGFVSSQPARTWEKGLICGNGTLGANEIPPDLPQVRK